MTARLENPYLAAWKEQLGSQVEREDAALRLLRDHQFDQLIAFRAYRSGYQRKYSFAIPCDEALLTISRYSPLVEIGCGTGYWARLLRELGTDIVCYDKAPPSPESSRNVFHPNAACWTEIFEGDETALDKHPDRSLFLCWPPAGDSMAYRALARYKGDIFVGVFEPPTRCLVKGSTADDQFFDLLASSWQLVTQVHLPNWELCWDSLFIFRAMRSP